MEMQKLGLGIMKWYLMKNLFLKNKKNTNHVQKRMGFRELATNENLGGESGGALTQLLKLMMLF